MITSNVIAACWCAAALAALLTARRGGQRGAATTVVITLLCASLHQWGWNQPIYQAGRQWLVDHDLYTARLWAKMALGAFVLTAMLLLLRPLWRRVRAWPRVRQIVLAAAAMDLSYRTVRTLSIDGWIPDVINFEPGKSVLCLTLAAIALATAPLARARRDDSSGPDRDQDTRSGGGHAFLGR